jgi:hypothetical protein
MCQLSFDILSEKHFIFNKISPFWRSVFAGATAAGPA